MEKLRDWRCRACNVILGHLDQGATELSVKYRDLYIWIQGGKVTIACRKCGTLNQLEQSQSSIEEIEETIKKGVEN